MKRFTPSMCQEPSSCWVACADVGARVGLGENHGRRPATLGGKDRPLLLLFSGLVEEDVGEAGTHRIHVHGRVGAEHVLHEGPLDGAGHRHAAELLADADLVPAALGDRADRLLEGRRQGDGVGVGIEDRGVAVGLGERIGNRTLGDPDDLREHLADGVFIEFGEGTLAENSVDSEDLEQVEHLVTYIALVVAHVSSSMRMPPAVGYLG
jgi:hypothetical protein